MRFTPARLAVKIESDWAIALPAPARSSVPTRTALVNPFTSTIRVSGLKRPGKFGTWRIPVPQGDPLLPARPAAMPILTGKNMPINNYGIRKQIAGGIDLIDY
jgi:hypothetical protein